MAPARSSSTRWTTKVPVAAMLRVVSLAELSGLCSRPRTISAGSSEKTLKKLNGAALTTPSGPKVVTSAIGRGTIVAMRSL
jgi:hypothetical protein